tara:strand:+ start:1255 stop:1536 length:282 start_codon:yes stop_codon:yes gene_type:complete
LLGTDHEIYEKFVAINAIVKIPALRFTVSSGLIEFRWYGGEITTMDMALYLGLEPLEIVQRLEYELEKLYQIKPLTYRADLSGFKRNPFSSQN